jgi:hypothetical protein
MSLQPKNHIDWSSEPQTLSHEEPHLQPSPSLPSPSVVCLTLSLLQLQTQQAHVSLDHMS